MSAIEQCCKVISRSKPWTSRLKPVLTCPINSQEEYTRKTENLNSIVLTPFHDNKDNQNVKQFKAQYHTNIKQRKT